jgi:DUF971 family protein
VRITWRDGHVAEYGLDYLRGWCPCAACQGHGTAPQFIPTKDAQLKHIGVVGNYALSFTWADGHDSGIYTYRYLRARCPCERCCGSTATR